MNKQACRRFPAIGIQRSCRCPAPRGRRAPGAPSAGAALVSALLSVAVEFFGEPVRFRGAFSSVTVAASLSRRRRRVSPCPRRCRTARSALGDGAFPYVRGSTSEVDPDSISSTSRSIRSGRTARPNAASFAYLRGRTSTASKPEAWEFPVGTRFWKEFSFGESPPSTRMIGEAAGRQRSVTRPTFGTPRGVTPSSLPRAGQSRRRNSRRNRTRRAVRVRLSRLSRGRPGRVLGSDALQLARS